MDNTTIIVILLHLSDAKLKPMLTLKLKNPGPHILPAANVSEMPWSTIIATKSTSATLKAHESAAQYSSSTNI